MKKTALLSAMLLSLVLVSGCSTRSVSTSKAKDATEKTIETSSGDVATATGTTIATSGSITIDTPTKGEDFSTNSNWNVIRGTVPAEAASIEVNGYRLHKFVAGSKNWNYIAATKMQTLKEGENEYVIKTFDKENNVIGETAYKINYNIGHTLPNVGTGTSFLILISLGLTSLIIFGRKFA